MQEPQNNTAILLFSRSVAEEIQFKNFAASQGKKNNFRLVHKMVQQTVSVASKTGLPLIISSSQHQTGNTFGEKLANAVESVFASGFAQVVIIGNDCPHLTSDLITQARKSIDKYSSVIGPATDGGAYLIGIHQNNYIREAWLGFNWQKADLADELVHYFTACTSEITQLPELRDADSLADLEKIFKTTSLDKTITRFIKSLESLLASYSLFNPKISFLHWHSIISRNFLSRGPPIS